MDYIKFLAVAAVMSMAMAPTAQAQDTELGQPEECDAVAATEAVDDDCIPVIPAPIAPLAATNLAFIIPAAATLLLVGIANGDNNGGTPDTQ